MGRPVLVTAARVRLLTLRTPPQHDMSDEERKAQLRASKAKQRARAAKAGLCVVCCINPKAKGISVCELCNEAAKVRVRESRA